MQARKHNGKTHKTHGNMQPPPRKGKENQQVKLVFSEQLSKLQTKQHQDTELLEEIRSFSKQRASIEKEYGQALQRLAIQHQKRDWQRGTTDAIASGSVFCVWRSLVDATAQIAATRLSAAKEYRKLSGHVSWSLHNAKDIRAKRGLERLQLVQGEVMDALRELHRVKKSYHHFINIAYVAREKAADAQIKFFTYRSCERKIHPICTTSTFLTKPLPTLNARLKECDDRLTEIRNEYLLTVAAVNAHQQHYHAHDLPLIMKQMDGDIYDDLRHHFTLLCGTEMDACLTTHKQFSSIWDSVTKVTRERNVQEFLEESISFSKTADFTFQPAPRDKVSTLQDGSTADEEGCLVKEVKKWATKAAKDHKIVAHGERVLQMLESRLQLLSGETGLSVEQKIAEVQESVRKATLGRVKAEARLALLSESVGGTECWLHDAMKQAEEELERERRLSEQRRSTEDFIEDELELTDFEDYHDDNGDIFAEPVSSFGVYVVPAACRALCSYEAGQSDKLSINEGEELQVMDDGDFEDCLKVCNSCGQVGCVPERQVQFLCLPAEDDVSHLNCFIAGNTEGTESRGFARALYSYQGQSAEELTFQEGAIIRLTRRHGAVDDGFWEGEVDGKIGVFPSLVVELLCDEEEEVQEKDEQEEETHQSPIQSSISALPPISSSPGGSSPGGAAPSGGEETEVEISDLDGNTSEAAVRDQTPAEIPSGRIKPCRAPPPPPAERLSAQR